MAISGSVKNPSGSFSVGSRQDSTFSSWLLWALRMWESALSTGLAVWVGFAAGHRYFLLAQMPGAVGLELVLAE